MRPPPDTIAASTSGTDPDQAPADDDRLTWSELAAGDLEALGVLFDRHSRAVYNFAFRHTASWSTAEEIVQATFVTTWQRADRGRLPALDHASARPWLLGVALNEMRNAHRGLRRVRRRGERWADLRDVEDDPAQRVIERVDDERRMTAVRAAMAGIPAQQREAIELVVWSGLSITEAARALGVAEGTVKSRLSRGRTRLATALALPAEDLS